MRFDDYIFPCYNVGNLVSVPKPFTGNQWKTLMDYRARAKGVGRPLTDKQQKTLIDLEYKNIQSQKYSLGETAKAQLDKLVFYERYGRRTSVSTAQMEKGLRNEKEGRDIVGEMLGMILTKDNEKKSNQWVRGIRDVKSDEVIIDIKTSWSFDTFTKHLREKPTELYLRQLDCYADLWGINDCLLAFVLTDTPNDLVEQAIRKENWTKGFLDGNGNVWEDKVPELVKLVEKHIFTRRALEGFCQQSMNVHIEWFEDFVEILDEERVHMVAHTCTQERLEQRNECLVLAREYMNNSQPINTSKRNTP